jgi:TPR repeat protein
MPPRDEANAEVLFRLAAEQGLVKAHYNLGVLYATAKSKRRRDRGRAMFHLILAATKGCADAAAHIREALARGWEKEWLAGAKDFGRMMRTSSDA